ncbi:hypothetical protein C0Q70_01890 [Pomacea canaliculata]|uniref:Uncharacterized protein n=1 Tax=Pomacea canaliculata TaxID=400727 RepID=A0A2T7Q0Q9_POMCA|nr:hypothetical protein C0Q70_01890 [Pomacea canaliculata]
MSVNIPGLCAVVVLYIVILVIGLIAGRKTAKSKSRDDIILANRSMGFFLSSFTVTATLIGGGYINGTAEAVAFQGLLWANAPVCYCISLIIGGLVYAPKMRRGEYVTMFDPFQLKYGRKVGAFLFLPQVLGDLFWAAAILSALGNTISVILDFDTTISIIISACVAVVYTFLGGLYSVAYTDVIQLVFIAVGLVYGPGNILKVYGPGNILKVYGPGNILKVYGPGNILKVYGPGNILKVYGPGNILKVYGPGNILKVYGPGNILKVYGPGNILKVYGPGNILKVYKSGIVGNNVSYRDITQISDVEKICFVLFHK